jgi:hypothetical protein
MKKLIVLLAVSVASAAFAAPAKQTQLPVEGLKWEEPMGPGSIKLAKISGDEKKGPFNAFLKMPAGHESGWHTHDADYTGVVLSGTIENVEQGGEADAKPLAAGSAWTQPGKRNHSTKCTGPSECLIFLGIKGGFTFHPMTAEGKPAPAPKKEAMAAPAAKEEAKKPAEAPKK